MLHYFKGSLAFTVVCLAAATAYGWSRVGTVAGTAELVWIVLVLAVLEISLSLDNAVVNAAVLKDMDAVWQGRSSGRVRAGDGVAVQAWPRRVEREVDQGAHEPCDLLKPSRAAAV